MIVLWMLVGFVAGVVVGFVLRGRWDADTDTDTDTDDPPAEERGTFFYQVTEVTRGDEVFRVFREGRPPTPPAPIDLGRDACIHGQHRDHCPACLVPLFRT